MPKSLQKENIYSVTYKEFVKEVAERTGNTYKNTHAFMNTITDTVLDIICMADETTTVQVRPIKGINIIASKKTRGGYRHPVTKEIVQPKMQFKTIARLEQPLKTFNTEERRQEFWGNDD